MNSLAQADDSSYDSQKARAKDTVHKIKKRLTGEG